MSEIEWNSRALPPVGVRCEWRASEKNEWEPVTVLAHADNGGTHSAILQREPAGWIGCAFPGCFRPIRTPEQIAEEERSEAVNDMFCIISSFDCDREAMCALYDAGYRKTEVKP